MSENPPPDVPPRRAVRCVLIVTAAVAAAAAVWLVARRRTAEREPVPVDVTVHTIGESVEGRPIVCHVAGTGTRTVMVIASIHGSEGAGTPLAEQLIRWAEQNPGCLRDTRVVVIPVANPDGLAAGRRHNARGVDLNRNFPAANRTGRGPFGPEPLSEPESRALASCIRTFDPEVIVSIHQPLACVDYDGPPNAQELAIRFANACGLPVEKLGARPGSLGAWFGETLGRPILTLELPAGALPDPVALWRQYGAALAELICGSG